MVYKMKHVDDDDDPHWFISSHPRVAKTKSSLCTVDDHLGKSEVMVQTWWSGEGFTFTIDSEGKTREIELSWQEWEALRLSVEAMQKD